MDSGEKFPTFVTCVLTAGAVAVQAQSKPVVEDELPLQGLLFDHCSKGDGSTGESSEIWDQRNNRKMLRFHQSKSWTLSCFSHVPNSSIAEKSRTGDSLMKTLEDLSDDDGSPRFGRGGDGRVEAVRAAGISYTSIMNLLQYESHEELTTLITMIGGAMRELQLQQEASTDESMVEMQLQRAQRHRDCEQCEARNPEFYAGVHYGPAEPPLRTTDEDESTDGLMEL